MTYSAIIAVHPDVEAEFVDENAMREMPLPLQKAVKGRTKGQLKKLAKGGVDWTPYIVWGSAGGLAAAEERWTDQIEIMATFARDGMPAGEAMIDVKTVGAVPDPVTVPAIDIVPATRTKKRWVKTPVTIETIDHEDNPVTIEAIKREKLDVEYVLGEKKDIQGNVIEEGKKDVLLSGVTVATVNHSDLNPDGTYTYQGEAPITITPTRMGTRLRPQHTELIGLLPDVVTHDENGNETSRAPAVDLTGLPIIFGHGVRQL